MTEDGVGLKDTPIQDKSHESLGLSDYADALTEFISKCDTPMTIALQGDWGSGKTSLMNLIHADLVPADHEGTKNRPHVVWFNTWQYSQFSMAETLAISLISRFIDDVKGNGQGEQPAALKKTMDTLSKMARFGTSMVATYLTGDAAGLDNAMAAADGKDVDDPSVAIKELKSHLNTLVENHEADRIVVFIDDLDRLVPQKAVELLESMKLFLDIPKCVYVLACDYQVVVQGLKSKFGVDEGELKGKSFFDKIIQVPFNMPLSQYQMDGYFAALLKKAGLEYEEKDLEDYIALASYSVGFNPRNLKRLFNSLLLLKLVVVKEEDVGADKARSSSKGGINTSRHEVIRILFAILCMQSHYEEVYRYLSQAGKLSTDILTSLSVPGHLEGKDDLANLKEDLGDKINDKSYIARLCQFMGAFIASIQLAGDTGDKDKKKLSKAEIDVLSEILSFSSLVSTDDQQMESFSDQRPKNRKLAQELVETLNGRFADAYQGLTLKYNGFRLFQRRNKNDAEVGLYLEVDEICFSLCFWLGAYEDNEVYCYAGFEAESENDASQMKEWFKQHKSQLGILSEDEDQVETDELCIYFWSKDFEDNEKWNDCRAYFKNFVLEKSEKVVPVFLAAIHDADSTR